MTYAWFNPFAGIAGDMALGALIDVGADPGAIEDGCRQLGYPGWRLQHETVDRGGIQATHVRVDINAEQTHHRQSSEIIEVITSSGLPARVIERAAGIFDRLARVEGALHGVDPADVTFHEIGAIDSIIDIVGVAVALDQLGVDTVLSAPVALGVGRIRAAHGMLPNPAPAVLRLLEGVPVVGLDVTMELTTPTGAALLASLAEGFGPVPDGMVRTSGYGAGTRNPPERPNVVQVVLGEAAPQSPSGSAAWAAGQQQEVVRLDVNVDDITGETVGYVIERLLEAGALDAWATPVTMKKSRPALVLSALCRAPQHQVLAELLVRETGSLGVRWTTMARWAAPRRQLTVTLGGQPVRVKLGPHGLKAEHEDAAALARTSGRPLREIAREAEALAAATRDAETPPSSLLPQAAEVLEGRLDSLDHNER